MEKGQELTHEEDDILCDSPTTVPLALDGNTGEILSEACSDDIVYEDVSVPVLEETSCAE